MKHLFSTIILLFTLGAAAAFAAAPSSLNPHPSYASADIREHGWFTLRCTDAAGNLKWEEKDIPNALTNGGEQVILATMFQGATAPTGYYLRLYNTTPVLTSTLSSLSSYEATVANGYNPANQTLPKNTTGWPTLAISGSYYQVSSETITITATGTVGPVTYCGISTSSDNTGTLISYAALSTTRTLSSGDSLQVTYKLSLQ